MNDLHSTYGVFIAVSFYPRPPFLALAIRSANSLLPTCSLHVSTIDSVEQKQTAHSLRLTASVFD